MAQTPSASWIDQFVLRGDEPDGLVAPFRQVGVAGELLARVAQERSGLPRATYEAVGTARYQAKVLADLARLLDEDVAVLARRADETLRRNVDPTQRARVLASCLSGTIRATATLMDTCYSMLALAEQLLVVRQTRSRLELMAAVEMLRGAAATAHLTVSVNLPRLTDSKLYDELRSGIRSVDAILARANRLSDAMRNDVASGPTLPAQRGTLMPTDHPGFAEWSRTSNRAP